MIMSNVRHKDDKEAHIENGIHENVYTMGIRSGNCPNQLFFGSPPSRDGVFLKELAEVPLRKSVSVLDNA